MIIYRVVNALKGEDKPVFIERPLRKEVYDDFSFHRDTIPLLLNYRDPFARTASTDSVIKRPISISKLIIHTIRPKTNWDFIRYSGYIKSATTKKLTAIMKINNQEVVMNVGESVQGVKLVRSLKDSVKVIYDGQSKFIQLNAVN